MTTESTHQPPRYLVVVDAVSKSFPSGSNSVAALRDVSLRVDRGGMMAIVGPSGSGKSTLLNLIGALDRPSGGRIVINGVDIATLDSDGRATFRNNAIGFIFQDFNLIPVMTAIENVMLPAQLSRTPANTDIRQRAAHLLSMVGLAPQADQSVNRLSGGQMQRVAIARALMNKPSLILADEPTANLDHATSENVLKILSDACSLENVTVLVSTHDPAILPWCRRVVTLRDGRLVSDELRETRE